MYKKTKIDSDMHLNDTLTFIGVYFKRTFGVQSSCSYTWSHTRPLSIWALNVCAYTRKSLHVHVQVHYPAVNLIFMRLLMWTRGSVGGGKGEEVADGMSSSFLFSSLLYACLSVCVWVSWGPASAGR